MKKIAFVHSLVGRRGLLNSINLAAGLRALCPPALFPKFFPQAPVPEFFRRRPTLNFFRRRPCLNFFCRRRYQQLYKFAIRNAFTMALQCKSESHFTVCVALQTVHREGETAL